MYKNNTVAEKDYDKLLEELPQELDKLIKLLDYDKTELDRLSSNLTHILSLENNNKTGVIDSVFLLLEKLPKLSTHKIIFNKIRKIIKTGDFDYLIRIIYLDSITFFQLREKDADLRKQLYDYAISEAGGYVRKTLLKILQELYEHNKQHYEVAQEIQEFLKTKKQEIEL